MADQTITTLATRFNNGERPIGVVLPLEVVIAQAVAAAAFYAGYGAIQSLVPPPPPAPAPVVNDPNDFLWPLTFAWGFPNPGFGLAPRIIAGSPVAAVDWVDESTVLLQSEWSVIRPLFVLYVERENSIQLEASRSLGVDVFGRSTSEIEADITNMEADLIPHRAFNQQIISV